MRWISARAGVLALTGAVLVGCASAPTVPSRDAAAAPTTRTASAPRAPGAPQTDESRTPATSPSGQGRHTDTSIELTQTAASTDRTVIAMGDITACSETTDEATAKVVAANPSATLLTLGDLAYPDGSADDYARCYTPAWGAFKARTRPVPGNHDYRTRDAAAYFAYFGTAAGDPTKGYYSYDLGLWHMVALNSNCDEIGGCQAGSPQEQWLRADLAAHPHACTLAYMHHPRFSSGEHGDTPEVDGLWRALAAARVDVVLTGHDHSYERFALMNADGARYGYGMRLIVVGTGGASLRPFTNIHPNSDTRASVAFGALKLYLRTNAYTWQFVTSAGTPFTDYRYAPCV